MDSKISDRKKRLDDFDKAFGRDLNMGVNKEESRSRTALYEGFDRAMSLAEKSLARGDYIEALELRDKASQIYASLLKNA